MSTAVKATYCYNCGAKFGTGTPRHSIVNADGARVPDGLCSPCFKNLQEPKTKKPKADKPKGEKKPKALKADKPKKPKSPKPASGSKTPSRSPSASRKSKSA